MHALLQQIADAVNNGLYFLALVCALTVPDMCSGLESANGLTTAFTTTAASTTSTQRAVRDARMAATTSGMGPRAAVRRQPGGKGRTDFASVTSARSASSIKCWLPILVARSRPDRIQRRTVSGSRLVRRAASGTVSIVVAYYNNLHDHTDHMGRRTVELKHGPTPRA